MSTIIAIIALCNLGLVFTRALLWMGRLADWVHTILVLNTVAILIAILIRANQGK